MIIHPTIGYHLADPTVVVPNGLDLRVVFRDEARKTEAAEFENRWHRSESDVS